MRKPVVTKKIGMKSELPMNSSSFFAAFSLTAALSERPERNAPTMSGSWMSCASELATATMAIITAKYAPSSPSTFFRMAATDTAQAEQDQRDEGRDLDQEQGETRDGEAALKGGHADREDDQRARVGEDRRAVGDRDRLELRLTQPRDGGRREQRM